MPQAERTTMDVTEYFKCLLYTAPSFDVDICLARNEDFNFGLDTVKGLFFEKGRFLEKEVSIPPIIDNTWFLPETMRKSLKGKHIMRRRFGFSKSEQYEIVNEINSLRHLLIPTLPIEKVDDIHRALNDFGGEIIVKPVDGLKGSDIWRIVAADKLRIQSNDSIFEYHSQDEFNRFCESKFVQNYIAQAFVKSQTVEGHPFDIRIHVIRTGKEQFYVEPFVRTGGRQKITSNIHTGGAALPAEWFLEEHFGKEISKQILNEITWIGKTLAPFYQQHLRFLMIDLGIDIGVEVKNDTFELKLFEINAYPGYIIPGKLGRVLNVTVASMEAYHYVHQFMTDSSKRFW